MGKKKDKEIIVDILTGAFMENERITSILRKGKTEKRIRIMAEYGYDLCKTFNGVFLSKDKTTAILFWRKTQFRRSFINWLRYLRVFFFSIRFDKVIPTLRREKLVENRRPDIPDYVYVWILGSDPGKTSMRGLADVRDHLNSIASEYNIPILIETTLKKLLRFYEYSGYEIYDELYDDSTDLTVWFLKKEVRATKG